MQHQFSVYAITAACALLTACGGGGGGDTAPTPFANVTVPANFDFSNTGSATVNPLDLVTTDFLNTANTAGVSRSKIHVQVWYMDDSNTRQTLVMSTLQDLETSFASGLTLSNIPKRLRELQAESYFWNASVTPAQVSSTGVLRITL
jgi:hypothetical protein